MDTEKEYFTVALKTGPFLEYIKMRAKMGCPFLLGKDIDSGLITAVARWLGFSKGHMSQVMHALEDPARYPEIRVSGTFIATTCKKLGITFDEIFTIIQIEREV